MFSSYVFCNIRKIKASRLYLTTRLQRCRDQKIRGSVVKTQFLSDLLNVFPLKQILKNCQSSISPLNCSFICENLLFVQCKTITKKFANLIIFFRTFSKFTKNQKLQDIFVIFINLPWGSCEVPQKCWACQVQPIKRLFDTNGLTDRQANYV